MARRIQTVLLNDIDFTDHMFDMSAHRRSVLPVESVKRFGLLHPPFLREADDGRWQIVTGFGRLAALQETGAEKVEACCLPAETFDRECALLKLAELRSTRKPDALEKGRFVQLIDPQPEEDDFRELCETIGVHPTQQALRRATNALQLSAAMQRLLSEEKLSEETVDALVDMRQEDRAALELLLDGCRPGLNVQRELLEQLQDISARDDSDIADIINSRELRDAINNPDLKHQQKTRIARDYIYRLRFPHICEWEDRFQVAVRDLGWPHDCKLSHNPFFEISRLKVELTFASRKELQAHIARLQSMCENENQCKNLRLK